MYRELTRIQRRPIPTVLIALVVNILIGVALRAQGLPQLLPLSDQWTPPWWATACAEKLASDDVILRAQVIDSLSEWKQEAPGMRLTVLRAGLRLPKGQAALECAARLQYEFIDAWESERVVELCLPEIAKPGTPVDYTDRLRFILGCTDLPQVFSALPADKEWPDDLDLGKIHVYMRPEHLPAVCNALRSSDPAILNAAYECIGSSLLHTDEHREVVAQLLWDLTKNRDPQALREFSSAPGFPEELRRTLHLLFVSKSQAVERIGCRRWALRWINDVQASVVDVPLLRQMIRNAQEEDWRFVSEHCILALGRIPGLPTGFSWDALVSLGDEKIRLCVTAAKARQGIAASERSLFDLADKDPLALALLWSQLPETAAAHFRGVLARQELYQFTNLARRAFNEGFRGLNLRWSRDLLALATKEMVQSKPLSAELIGAWNFLPGLRNPQCADATLLAMETEAKDGGFPRAIDPANPGVRIAASDLLGYLEIARPNRLLNLLRTWARLPNAAASRWALTMLARLGDEESADLMIRFLENSSVPEEEPIVRYLGRVPSSTTFRYLVSRRAPHNQWPLIQLAGLPEESASWCADNLDADQLKALIALAKSKDIGGLLALLLGAKPQHPINDIGKLKHPLVTSHLRSLQGRRELGLYWWATGELALQGDPRARQELWTVMTSGRYQTLNSLSANTLSLGRNPAAVAYCLSQLDTNCCRPYLPSIIENATGRNADFTSADFATLQSTFAQWWDPRVHRLQFSKIANRLVIL